MKYKRILAMLLTVIMILGIVQPAMATANFDSTEDTNDIWTNNGNGTATNTGSGEVVIVGLDMVAGTDDDNKIVNPAKTVLLEDVQVEFDSDNRPYVDLGNGFKLYPGSDGLIGTDDDVVTDFGSYPQSDTTGEISEPLSWRLLDIDAEEGEAVLMTEKVVEAIVFNPDNDANDWKSSNLRSWLNSRGGKSFGGDTEGFYDAAFTDDEKALIKLTDVKMDYSDWPMWDNTLNGDLNYQGTTGTFPAYDRTRTNPNYWVLSTTTGEDTQDYVYAISGEEAFEYFSQGTFVADGWDLVNYTNGYFNVTDYAKGQGAKYSNTEGFGEYGDTWARSPGRGVDTSGNYYGVFWSGTGSMNVGRAVNIIQGTTTYGTMPMVTVDIDPLRYEEGVTVEEDENSPTGYTATFVYRDASATSVYLQGDAMYFADGTYLSTGKLYTPYEWEKGMYPISGVQAIAATDTTPAIPATPKYNVQMQKIGRDLWIVSLPLPSGAYKYCYYVDGNGNPSNGTKVLDPANLPLQNPNSGNYANFSIVYMPFDSEKQDEDRSYMLPRDGENGSLVFETINADINGQNRAVQIVVYLPYGYDENRSEKYNVLYISHGGGGHERDWTNDGTMPNIMDNMIAEGTLEPTIVVALSYNTLGGSDATLATLMAQLQEEYIIPLMESKYNASPEVNDRAFAGLSQGGLMTSYMMVNATAGVGPKYGTYGIWSAKSVPTDELEARKDDAEFLAELKKLNIIVDSGIQDKKHYDNSIALVSKLQELGVETPEPTYPDGGHDWLLWPKLLVSFAEQLWKEEPSIKTCVADDGSGTWEYDSDYGYFEISRSELKNSTTVPGPEEERVRDYNSGGSTLSFTYGDGLFVRMDTDDGTGTKTVDGKTISTLARDSFYTLYCGTTDREVGEEFYPDANEKIGGRMLDKKLRDVHSYTNFCYQSYDTGGGKLGVDDEDFGQIYIYVLTESFDNAYKRQQAESAGTETKAEYAPEDYPDKYYLYGDDSPPNGTNTTLSAGSSKSGRNVIVAKFPISMSPSEMDLYWTADGENAEKDEIIVMVGGEFTLGIHTQIKSTWGWDAPDGWNKFVNYEFTAEDTDIIDFEEIDPNVPVPGNPLNPVTSAKVTAKEPGVTSVEATLKANSLGLFEETASTVDIRVVDEYPEGVTVEKDDDSPTGYTAHFVYENAEATEVDVVGRFMFLREGDNTTLYSPWEWENGMYPAIFQQNGVEYTQPMDRLEGTDKWYGSFPIPSGAYHYFYGVVDDEGDYKEMGARNSNRRTDPANPPMLLPDVRSSSSDYLSIAYGIYDPVKQSKSDDCTTWNPVEMNDPNAESGSYESKVYTDSLGQEKYLGIYLPPNYDPNRAEPYKTIYISHGGGGALNDWLSHGYVGNIMDNRLAGIENVQNPYSGMDQANNYGGAIEEAIIVTMTNSGYTDFGGSATDEHGTPSRDSMINNIIPFMENNYNVSEKVQDRAVMGLSQGGAWVTRLFYDYPNEFGYFGIHSTSAANITTAINNNEFTQDHVGKNMFMGAGNLEFSSTSGLASFARAAQEKGLIDEDNNVILVHGHHDWFTWPALFEIMLDDFLWQDSGGESLRLEKEAAIAQLEDYAAESKREIDGKDALSTDKTAAKAAVDQALEAAKDSVNAATDISGVNTAADNGKTAMDNIVKGVPLIDKSSLEALYNEHKDLEKGIYTDASWNVFQNALSDAKRVLDDNNATQAQIDAAKATLENAYGDLKKIEYKITASANTGGDVPAETAVAEGGDAEITVKADSGYKLIAILVDGVTADISEIENNIYTIENVKKDISLRALFVKDRAEDFAAKFTDVPIKDGKGNRMWYYDAVDTLVGLGIIKGISETTYEPESNVKRSEFTKLLFELALTMGVDAKEVNEIPFTDMPIKNYWAIGYIGWAYENEIVKGYDSKHFGPEDSISRQDMALMLQRFFEEYMGYELPGDTTKTFGDQALISDYARGAVNYVVRTGLMQGDDQGKFNPKDNSLRSQVAQVLFNYLIF